MSNYLELIAATGAVLAIIIPLTIYLIKSTIKDTTQEHLKKINNLESKITELSLNQTKEHEKYMKDWENHAEKILTLFNLDGQKAKENHQCITDIIRLQKDIEYMSILANK